MESLPPRGAWIEIGDGVHSKADALRRSPHGERGLKSDRSCLPLAGKASLPPRGAWIEISVVGTGGKTPPSLPPRGAWIEISSAVSAMSSAARRSPHGERGLKCPERAGRGWGSASLPPRGAWIEMFTCEFGVPLTVVAPPTGSVD